MDAKRTLQLLESREERKKQRLRWFNSAEGKELRLKVETHICLEGERQRCAMCNVNNSHNAGGKKIKTYCNTCDVHLCTDAGQRRSSCWYEWHSEEVLYQRVNVMPKPRRKYKSEK